MQRWNGWGDPSINMEISKKAHLMLKELVGDSMPVPDVPIEQLLKNIPESRLPKNQMISVDPADRLLHAHGQSLPDWISLRGGTLPLFPDGVAHPSSLKELEKIIRFASENGIVIIPYGGGTSVVGHLNVPLEKRPVLSISMKRLNQLISIDKKSHLATFEAGITGPDIEARLRAHGFTLGHYPQSFEYSSLGGWIATRSSGQQSRHFGRIEQLFAGGEIITPKGKMNLPPFPASAAGPDLREIIMGSEGRLGVISKAILRISPIPEKDIVYGVFFRSWDEATEAARNIANSKIPYSMFRLSTAAETMTSLALIAGHDTEISILTKYLRIRGISIDKACMCLIGFTGTDRIVKSAKKEAFGIIRNNGGVSAGPAMGNSWIKNRFRTPYLRNTLWDAGYAVDTLETAVTWDKVNLTLESIESAIKSALGPFNESIHVFSHLSHVYPTGSSIYTQFVFRITDSATENLNRWKAIKQAASNAIVDAGGTISHQHGVGKDHAPYIKAEKGAVGLEMIKHIFEEIDPEHRMSPGNIIQKAGKK